MFLNENDYIFVLISGNSFDMFSYNLLWLNDQLIVDVCDHFNRILRVASLSPGQSYDCSSVVYGYIEHYQIK